MRGAAYGVWRRLGMAGVLACGVWCASCATDQRGDVAAYRRIADPDGAPPAHRAGEELSLLQALRLTAFRNEQLASQGERYIQALAERERRAASLRPTLDFVGGVELRENTGNAGVVQSSAGVGAQYRLLTGMGDFRSVQAAELGAEAQRWLILDLREALLLEAARAYYETLRAERLSSVLESSVAAQIERLDEAKARNEAGFARPLDVAQIEALVSRTRAQRISAEGQAREARSVLTVLTNAELAGSALSDGFEVPAETPRLEDLLVLAERHRQDMLAARQAAAAARLDVDAAISQFSPAITINLDYFLARGPDESAAAIASLIAVRVPIFSAGRIEAEVRSAWSVFRERVLEYRLRAREVRRDVEVAWSQLRASQLRIAELQTQVSVARETLELAEAAYDAGLGTNLDRVTAQDELLNAELAAVTEDFNAKIASLAIRRACGLLSAELAGASLPVVRDEERIAPESPVLDRARPAFDGASATEGAS